jgi:hypothetical protein
MELNYADIIDLVLSESKDPEGIIKHICSWKYKIDKLLLQIAIGVIVSITLVSFSDYENIINNIYRISFLIFTFIVLVVIAITQYFRLKRNKDLYIASIKNYYILKRYLGV